MKILFPITKILNTQKKQIIYLVYYQKYFTITIFSNLEEVN